MYIDFFINKTDINDAESRDTLAKVLSLNSVNSITVPFYFLKNAKAAIDTTIDPKKIDLSCLIDYPLGISDIKTRQFAVSQAIRGGATCIDICMPQNLAANRKYDKIREDIKNISDISLDKDIKYRYILEYRLFDHNCLKKICEIFENFNIQYVFPSSGYFIDNLADNLIASVFLYQNSKNINILCTGDAWTDKHFANINKSGLFGIRLSSYHGLKNYLAFNYTQH